MKKYSLLMLCILSISYKAEGATVYTAKNKNEFDNHLKNCTVAIAEFYSPTCRHCINFNNSGTFEKIAEEFPDVRCVRVSYYEAPTLFGDYRVNGFPTFLVFKNGDECKELRQAGGLSKTTIEDKIKQAKK